VSYYLLAPRKPDPLLTGSRPVTIKDLPSPIQGLDDATLKRKLDKILREGETEWPEKWWITNLESQEAEEARLLAAYLGETQIEVRSLLWFSREGGCEDWNKFFTVLDSAESLAKSEGLNEELAYCYYWRGECLERLGLYYLAVDSTLQALAVYEELDQSDRQIRALSRLGGIYRRRMGDSEAGLSYYERCQTFIDDVAPDRLVAVTGLWGFSLTSCGRYPESLPVFAKATSFSEEAGTNKRMLDNLPWLGLMYLLMNQRDEGEATLRQAMLLVHEVNDCFDPSSPYQYLAEYLFSTGEEQVAISLLEDALADISVLEDSVDPEAKRANYWKGQLESARITTLADIGDMHLILGKPETALACFQEADALTEGDEFIMPGEQMELNLAETYIELGRFDEAIKELNEMHSRGPVEYGYGAGFFDPELLMLFGTAYLCKGDYDTAANYLMQAQDACWSDETEYWQTVHAEILQLKAEIAVAQADNALAIACYSLALEHQTRAVRMFIWDTSLRSGLAEQMREVAAPHAMLLDEAGKTDKAKEVRRLAEAADAAKALAFQPLPTEATPASQALQEYRTTLTYLDEQRRDRDFRLRIQDETPPPLGDYWTKSDLYWKYHREWVRQQAQIKCDLDTRIAVLEVRAAEQLVELRKLDPQTAAIIELQPSSEADHRR
jgi:tetratricopeptide (TPR) repeat protein